MSFNKKLAILGMMASSLLAIPASAGTDTFPGMNCSGGTVSFGNIKIGTSFNNSTATCSVDRDTSANITGMWVRVDDEMPSKQISCQAKSCNSFGTSCNFSSTKGSGNSFTGNKSLSLGSLTTFSTGYTYISCDVPQNTDPQSRLLSYRVDD